MNKISLKKRISALFGSNKDKEDIIEELEELLILSDISAKLVMDIIQKVKKKEGMVFIEERFIQVLKDEILEIFEKSSSNDIKLPENQNVIMLVGINGSGKTTQVAKLGHYFIKKNKMVLLCASDTFRAAGCKQLFLWGDRLNIPVIGGAKGADPGSVVYNSLNSFKSRGYDILIIDTAGRVQTKESLMKELRKLTTIIKKYFPQQPAEILMVVDATMGQNTLEQAKKFKEFSGLTGLILAKLDGSAKGGSVINIVNEMGLPVKFAGVGEKEDDLIEFDNQKYINDLFAE